MAVWMQPIKLGYPKIGHEPHGIYGTERTRCHGCGHFCCIRQNKVTQPWRFYCEALARTIDPSAVTKKECPENREAKRGHPRKGSAR